MRLDVPFNWAPMGRGMLKRLPTALMAIAGVAALAGASLWGHASNGPSGPHEAAVAVAAPAPQVAVAGKNLVNTATGAVLHLTGVDRSGPEYACAEGWGIFDGPTDTDAAIAAMAGWHINAVRIPLNEDCWLGINGVKPAYSGATYAAAIGDYVTRLESFGITPILNLHFSAPGATLADGQAPMADEDHSPAFWVSVATYFKADHHVIFDLFNEPHPDSNRDSAAAWSCVLNGGTCPGVSFAAAGMQQLVNVVRGAGATQPLMVAGPQYAGDLDQWLAYEPSDPARQLVASVHIYEPDFAPCASSTCWTTVMDPLAAQVPIVAGEVGVAGTCDFTASGLGALLSNMDASGISYLAWSWRAGTACTGGPNLLVNYSGPDTNYDFPEGWATYGTGYRAHLAALWGSSPSPSPSVSSPSPSPSPSRTCKPHHNCP